MTLTTLSAPLARRTAGVDTITLAGAVIGTKYDVVAVMDRDTPVPREAVRCVIAFRTPGCTFFWYFASLTGAWTVFKRATTPRGAR